MVPSFWSCLVLFVESWQFPGLAVAVHPQWRGSKGLVGVHLVSWRRRLRGRENVEINYGAYVCFNLFLNAVF